jgi:transposase
MNKFKTVIGIDVSKHTFDATKIMASDVSFTQHKEFKQTPKGIEAFLYWAGQGSAVSSEILICLEHTGLYIHGLMEQLSTTQFGVWVEMPLRIKRCIGLQRGGNDKLSSLLITQYALRYQDGFKQWTYEDSFIQKLRHFTAQRQRLLTAVKQLEVPVKELKEIGCTDIAKQMEVHQKKVLHSLKVAIEKIESNIQKLVINNQEAQHKINLVTSLKGVSTQTAINLYVYTKGFTAFANAKQLASYCGVVPFERKSGISVRYKPKISPFANKELKRLLHLCAMSAIQHDVELKQYYQRKVLAGKNKMSVVNAVRNKLILRVFAVLRDDRPWVENYQRSCA